MPKHTGMSQEKKNTDTKEWCSHSHVGGSEFPKRGTAPSPSPPARRRLRGSAAGHARLLAASDAAVFPPPRAYRRTVALGGGGFRGPWRAGTRGPAAPFRSLPRLCRRLASPRRCARLIPRDWQAAQRAGAGAGAGCRPATRPPSEQRSSVARSHSFFTPDLSLWTLSRSLPGLSRRPKVRTASPAGQAGSVSAGPTHSQREAHTQTHTHTRTYKHTQAGTHTHTQTYTVGPRIFTALRCDSALLALRCFRSARRRHHHHHHHHHRRRLFGNAQSGKPAMPCLPVPYHTVPSHPVCLCMHTYTSVASCVPRCPPASIGRPVQPPSGTPPSSTPAHRFRLSLSRRSTASFVRHSAPTHVLGRCVGWVFFSLRVCVCDVIAWWSHGARAGAPRAGFVGSGRAGAATGTAPHLMLHRSGGCPQRARHQGEGTARQGRLPQKAKHACGSTASSLKCRHRVTGNGTRQDKTVTARDNRHEANEASRVIDHDVSC